MKRVFDLTIAAAALVIFAPAFILIAIAIWADSGRPVVYTQMRSGRSARPFRIYKFRTMHKDADVRLHEVLPLNVYYRKWSDARLYKVPNDPRVTRVGRLLRAYCVDELPQLINVLKGDMSIVGPRPLTLMEDAHVSGVARRRATVRPGITGLWQVSGRNELPFEEMMRLDCAYVDRWSFAWDVRLLMQTLPTILLHREST